MEEGRAEKTPNGQMNLSSEYCNFKKTLEALEVKIEGKKVVGRLLLDDESPLMLEVMAVTLPPKYIDPILVYKGKTDTNHHVQRFNKIIGIRGLNDF